jgi:hypothetical protein
VPEGARWLGECPAEDLLAHLCSRFTIAPDELVAAADAFGGATRPEQADYVVGAYLAYSWAWSPSMHGRLIRGLLTVDQAARGALRASYVEDLPQASLRFEGSMVRHGHGLATHLDLVGGGGGETISASLIVAGWPATVLCGHFVGMVVQGIDSRRAVSRVAMLRLNGDIQGTDSHGYVEAIPDAVSADLAQHGFTAADRLAPVLLDFLGGATAGADYVTAGDCGPFAELLAVGAADAMAASRAAG